MSTPPKPTLKDRLKDAGTFAALIGWCLFGKSAAETETENNRRERERLEREAKKKP